MNTHFKNLAFGAWTYQEDRAVWLAGNAPGPTKWAELSRQLGTRTDNQCLQRFKCLTKYKHTLESQQVRTSVFIKHRNELLHCYALQ